MPVQSCRHRCMPGCAHDGLCTAQQRASLELTIAEVVGTTACCRTGDSNFETTYGASDAMSAAERLPCMLVRFAGAQERPCFGSMDLHSPLLVGLS